MSYISRLPTVDQHHTSIRQYFGGNTYYTFDPFRNPKTDWDFVGDGIPADIYCGRGNGIDNEWIFVIHKLPINYRHMDAFRLSRRQTEKVVFLPANIEDAEYMTSQGYVFLPTIEKYMSRMVGCVGERKHQNVYQFVRPHIPNPRTPINEWINEHEVEFVGCWARFKCPEDAVMFQLLF